MVDVPLVMCFAYFYYRNPRDSPRLTWVQLSSCLVILWKFKAFSRSSLPYITSLRKRCWFLTKNCFRCWKHRYLKFTHLEMDVTCKHMCNTNILKIVTCAGSCNSIVLFFFCDTRKVITCTFKSTRIIF